MTHIFTKNAGGVDVPVGANDKAGQYLCLACGTFVPADLRHGPCKYDRAISEKPLDYGPVPCPTCKATGTDLCIKGRFPGPVWDRQEPYPEGHTSRIKVNAQE